MIIPKLYGQENVKQADLLVYKIFTNNLCDGIYFLTEYDEDTKIAFGLGKIGNLSYDFEYGYFSPQELLDNGFTQQILEEPKKYLDLKEKYEQAN